MEVDARNTVGGILLKNVEDGLQGVFLVGCIAQMMTLRMGFGRKYTNKFVGRGLVDWCVAEDFNVIRYPNERSWCST